MIPFRHHQVVERQHIGGGTAISGGGTPDTGGGTPFRPVPAEFNHCSDRRLLQKDLDNL